MIDQMLSLHPSIPYLHMGCDEVYYRLVHPQCVNLNFRDDADLFIRYTFFTLLQIENTKCFKVYRTAFFNQHNIHKRNSSTSFRFPP
jgi:hypothetical protein